MPHISYKELKTLIVEKYKGDQDKISDWHGKYNAVRRIRKNKIFDKQGGKCDVCGRNMLDFGQKKNSATIEHIVPVSHGGSDDPSNWTITCGLCNTIRGNDIEYQEFKKNHKKYHKRYNVNRNERAIARANKTNPEVNTRLKKIIFNIAIIFSWNQYVKDCIMEDIK